MNSILFCVQFGPTFKGPKIRKDDNMTQKLNQKKKQAIRTLVEGSMRMTDEELNLAVPYSWMMHRLMEGENGLTPAESKAVIAWYKHRISRFGNAGRFGSISEILSAYLSEAEDACY